MDYRSALLAALRTLENLEEAARLAYQTEVARAKFAADSFTKLNNDLARQRYYQQANDYAIAAAAVREQLERADARALEALKQI